jgi:hypothetical protein
VQIRTAMTFTQENLFSIGRGRNVCPYVLGSLFCRLAGDESEVAGSQLTPNPAEDMPLLASPCRPLGSWGDSALKGHFCYLYFSFRTTKRHNMLLIQSSISSITGKKMEN